MNISKHLFAAYNADLAFEMYLSFIEGVDEVRSLLWVQLIPLVGMVVSKDFSRRPIDVREELSLEGIAYVAELLDSKRLPINSAGAFRGYIYTSLKNRFLKTLEVMFGEADLGYDYECFGYKPINYGPTQMDAALLASSLDEYIRRITNAKIRFTGLEREAVEFLVAQLVGGENTNCRMIEEVFDISSEHSRFFLDYATVLVRMALYEIRG